MKDKKFKSKNSFSDWDTEELIVTNSENSEIEKSKYSEY